MNKFKKSLMALMIVVGTCTAPVAALSSFGQELEGADGQVVDANTKTTSACLGMVEVRHYLR